MRLERTTTAPLLLALLAACATSPEPPPPDDTPPPAPSVAPEPAPATPEPTPEPEPEPEPEPAPVPVAACHSLDVAGKWTGHDGADQWIPGVYRADDVPDGAIILTFDDGLHAHTGSHLDALKKHGLHATFFIVSRSVRPSNYHLIRRMVEEGHAIGSHTYSHPLDIAAKGGKDSLAYVQAEYGLSQVMVDLALVAESEEDFKELRKRVIEKMPYSPEPEDLVRRWPEIQERRDEILSERGYEKGQHPYRLLYMRGPGGNPYFGSWSTSSRNTYSKAARKLGLLNVHFHSWTQDSDPKLPKKERFDTDRLVGTFVKRAKHGGVHVAHDRIPVEPIQKVTKLLANSEDYRVMTLDEWVEQKYGCPATAIVELYERRIADHGDALPGDEETPRAPTPLEEGPDAGSEAG